MSKHTPGPWRVVDGHYPCMSEIDGPSFKISIVMSAADLSFDESMRREADARLIAAAPELYAALIECRDALAKCIRGEPVMVGFAHTAALDALAKAEGTAPKSAGGL